MVEDKLPSTLGQDRVLAGLCVHYTLLRPLVQGDTVVEPTRLCTQMHVCLQLNRQASCLRGQASTSDGNSSPQDDEILGRKLAEPGPKNLQVCFGQQLA